MSNKVCPCNCVANCSECELEEKKLKALEIIKDKNVDTILIKTSKNYDDYCSDFAIKVLSLKDEKLLGNGEGINEEEYDLLKEVLL